MNKIRKRFTKWYVSKGYIFGYSGIDPFEARWACPFWVRPLLFLFSPSCYCYEVYTKFWNADTTVEVNPAVSEFLNKKMNISNRKGDE